MRNKFQSLTVSPIDIGQRVQNFPNKKLSTPNRGGNRREKKHGKAKSSYFVDPEKMERGNTY